MTAVAAPAVTPAAASWRIDPTHSNVEFAVRHLMISRVKGRFGEVAGIVQLNADDPTASFVDVTINAASIDTREPQRDAHLRSADFFDADRFPTLRFRSTRVSGDADDLRVTGALTIRDVTREVTLVVTPEGHVTDPWGGVRAGYSAKTKINRQDFGLTWNQVLEAGGVVVGDEITISIDVELVQDTAS
jgi:polyisoprenoid-binding protein YceI